MNIISSQYLLSHQTSYNIQLHPLALYQYQYGLNYINLLTVIHLMGLLLPGSIYFCNNPCNVSGVLTLLQYYLHALTACLCQTWKAQTSYYLYIGYTGCSQHYPWTHQTINPLAPFFISWLFS